MYTSSIIMLLSWPVTIVLAYFAARIALNLYEKKVAAQAEETEGKKTSA